MKRKASCIMDKKIGVVDVGGGYRGIYTAGVLDYCMVHGIHFDLGIGVSAGSANLISYAAGQYGRNYRFFTEYGRRKEYAGLRNFLFKKSFLDLDYIYNTLSNSDGEDPLDFAAVARNPMDFLVVATEAESARVKYFEKKDIFQDDYSAMKASCAIPFVCHPYMVDGVPYYDGALSDPVPVQKAFEWGCDLVVLLLTLPENTVRTCRIDRRLAARIRKKYPLAAEKLILRTQRYQEEIDLARQFAAQGKLLIVAPNDTCGVSTLTRDAAALHRLYEKGYHDAVRIVPFLERSGLR